MSVPNPMEDTFSSPTPSVSKKTFTISGILTSVFGLDEIHANSQVSEVTCLWLLHPRLQTKETMEPIAATVLADWNRRLNVSSGMKGEGWKRKGLIAVAFDGRNHGSREVDACANQAWKQGNETHAQDMFSIFQGTTIDTMQLMDYISAYAFPNSEYRITDHIALGVSLGGHSVWQLLLQEPRVSAAVVIIGCPDFTKLLTDRARLSKLKTWTSTSPPGCEFLGSKDFPAGLIQAVQKWDPRGIFCGSITFDTLNGPFRGPSDRETPSTQALLDKGLGGRSILNLSGGKDKMVPYSASEGFLSWLKKAVAKDGWYRGRPITLDDIVYQEAGHELTMSMVQKSVQFIGDCMSASPITTANEGRIRDFKI